MVTMNNATTDGRCEADPGDIADKRRRSIRAIIKRLCPEAYRSGGYWCGPDFQKAEALDAELSTFGFSFSYPDAGEVA